jgi:hypothetical protein
VSAQDELKRLFRSLHKHQDLIINAYLDGESILADDVEHDKAIDELIRLRLAWRPGRYEGVRLTRELNGLLQRMLHDSRRISVDANVGGKIQSIEELVNNYKAAQERQDRQFYLHAIEAEVHDLVCDINDSSQQLWRQIDGEFGYVTTLEMKLRENKRVLTQAERLNEGLGLIDLTELSDIAGSDIDLRRLLVRWLPEAASQAQKELSDALHRLNGMLFHLRRQQARARMVNAFYRRYQIEPGYQPLDYSAAEIPNLLNQVDPLTFEGHADLDDNSHEVKLTEWIVGLRKEKISRETEKAESITAGQVQEHVKVQVSPLMEAVEYFYIQVIETAAETSALEHFPLAPNDCEPELWLYAIASRYNNMRSDERTLFKTSFKETRDPVFNGRMLVRDISLKLRAE